MMCCWGRISIMNGAQHGINRLDIPIREQPGEWPRSPLTRHLIGDRAVVMADIKTLRDCRGVGRHRRFRRDRGWLAGSLRFRNQSDAGDDDTVSLGAPPATIAGSA